MNNAEILKNAPKGATHIGPWVYRVSGKNIPLENGLRNHKQEGFRSLADIKTICTQYERIQELEALCKECADYLDTNKFTSIHNDSYLHRGLRANAHLENKDG